MTSISNKCANLTTPLDISPNNVTGKCDSKCEFNFKYQSSSCSVKNKGSYISVSYDGANESPVKYNLHKYNVEEIRIYSPSIHTYLNRQAPAEIVIIHNTPSGGNKLAVCVAVTNQVSSSKGSAVINDIIMGAVNKAPQDGDSATLNNIGTYTLNNIVPMMPKKIFYTYSGQEPFDDCLYTFDYIVFPPSVSDVAINSDCLTKLRKIIESSDIISKQPSKTTPIFVNINGPNNGYIDEGIYIDCVPAGVSDESEIIVKDKLNSNNESAKDFFTFNNPWFLGFIIFIMCILLLGIIQFYDSNALGALFKNFNANRKSKSINT